MSPLDPAVGEKSDCFGWYVNIELVVLRKGEQG